MGAYVTSRRSSSSHSRENHSDENGLTFSMYTVREMIAKVEKKSVSKVAARSCIANTIHLIEATKLCKLTSSFIDSLTDRTRVLVIS